LKSRAEAAPLRLSQHGRCDKRRALVLCLYSWLRFLLVRMVAQVSKILKKSSHPLLFWQRFEGVLAVFFVLSGMWLMVFVPQSTWQRDKP